MEHLSSSGILPWDCAGGPQATSRVWSSWWWLWSTDPVHEKILQSRCLTPLHTLRKLYLTSGATASYWGRREWFLDWTLKLHSNTMLHLTLRIFTWVDEHKLQQWCPNIAPHYAWMTADMWHCEKARRWWIGVLHSLAFHLYGHSSDKVLLNIHCSFNTFTFFIIVPSSVLSYLLHPHCTYFSTLSDHGNMFSASNYITLGHIVLGLFSHVGLLNIL